MNRQAQVRQCLRHQNTQARIVDRQSSFERIDRENSRLRRKTKNGLYARARFHIGRHLGEERLEKIGFKNLGRIGDRAGRKLLTAAK